MTEDNSYRTARSLVQAILNDDGSGNFTERSALAALALAVLALVDSVDRVRDLLDALQRNP